MSETRRRGAVSSRSADHCRSGPDVRAVSRPFARPDRRTGMERHSRARSSVSMRSKSMSIRPSLAAASGNSALPRTAPSKIDARTSLIRTRSRSADQPKSSRSMRVGPTASRDAPPAPLASTVIGESVPRRSPLASMAPFTSNGNFASGTIVCSRAVPRGRIRSLLAYRNGCASSRLPSTSSTAPSTAAEKRVTRAFPSEILTARSTEFAEWPNSSSRLLARSALAFQV